MRILNTRYVALRGKKQREGKFSQLGGSGEIVVPQCRELLLSGEGRLIPKEKRGKTARG